MAPNWELEGISNRMKNTPSPNNTARTCLNKRVQPFYAPLGIALESSDDDSNSKTRP